MKIFVTGLCTLHWGRLEYGNVGNYYIIEPLFRQLHRVFPDAEVITTFQMTDSFIQKEHITVLPMSLFYSWKDDDVSLAEHELDLAHEFEKTGTWSDTTAYIDAVTQSSLLIDVSGDMWGDNAEHVGHDRFYTDLLKLRTAQLAGVKTVLFAGTPGPFTDEKRVDFAREVFSHFDLVLNREPTSTHNLEKWHFNMDRVKDFACPAFIFEPEEKSKVLSLLESELPKNTKNPLVGFSIGGFNMPIGPYDMWPRDDDQYTVFAKAIEYIVNSLEATVVLISHTNGFDTEPVFLLKNGRDYPILKQLQEVVRKRGIVKNMDRVLCIENPHIPRITKGIIGCFDMMVTGRVHASVAAISQCVPTVF